MGEASAQIVTVETKQGNIYVKGRLSCDRVSPEPRTTLFAGPLDAKLTEFAAVLPDARQDPGFGLGAYGALNPQGWVVGPALALPPLRLPLFGVQAEVTGAVGFGPGGAQGAATVVLRRSGS